MPKWNDQNEIENGRKMTFENVWGLFSSVAYYDVLETFIHEHEIAAVLAMMTSLVLFISCFSFPSLDFFLGLDRCRLALETNTWTSWWLCSFLMLNVYCDSTEETHEQNNNQKKKEEELRIRTVFFDSKRIKCRWTLKQRKSHLRQLLHVYRYQTYARIK